MAESLNSTLVDEKNKIHSTAPWAWLFEVVLSDDPATDAIRVSGSHEQVTFDGNVYYPFPIQLSALARSKGGMISDLEVTISNVGGIIAPYLESGRLLDAVANVGIVHENDLSLRVNAGRFTVKNATLSASTAILALGLFNVFEAPLPAQRYNRTRCRFVYGQAGCSYNTSLPNAISGSNPLFDPTTCDLGLETSNGCRVHGDNEVANGMQRLHPLYFGGFPGIPKGRARV